MITIAVDAMGGDHAPRTEVEGAIRAARSLDVKVILVGREELIREELDKHEEASALPIQIVHASERVSMEESAAKAVRGCGDGGRAGSVIHVIYASGTRPRGYGHRGNRGIEVGLSGEGARA